MPEIPVIEMLKADLLHRPSPSLILAACWIIDNNPRRRVPDWVEALSEGALDEWESAIEVAREDLEADDE